MSPATPSNTTYNNPDLGKTEPKVTAAMVGAGGSGLAALVVIWLANHYANLELTPTESGAIVTAVATVAARIFGWLKRSPYTRVSEGWVPPDKLIRTAEERRDAQPAVPPGDLTPEPDRYVSEKDIDKALGDKPNQEDGKGYAPSNLPPGRLSSQPGVRRRRPGRTDR